MRILFCTDGSKISFSSIKNISHWIKGGTVDILCAVDLSFLPDEIKIEDENFSYSCANVADTILDYAESEIKKLGFKSNIKIKSCGSAIDSILSQSEKQDYDLILMGTHGKKGIRKWLGSVSAEIINSSKTSSFISRDENKCKNMLITTDGTKCSAGIIKSVLPNLKLDEKEIHICMVNDDPHLLFLEGALDKEWILEIQRQQQYYASKAIQEIESIIKEQNVNTAKIKIMTGNPSEKIVEYAKENEIDMIIMGSQNKSKLDRFLTGSVSKRVIENVSCDVWLARCKQFDPKNE